MASTSDVALESRVKPATTLYKKLSPGPGRPATEVASHQRARIHSAMVALTAKLGYGAVTVRELTRTAGVSSRAFYENFGGKEDCFLRTYDLVVRRAVKRIVASPPDACGWQKELGFALGAFTRELEREPHATRFALVEAYGAGPTALAQILSAERTFEQMIADTLVRAHALVVPRPLIEGIVAGLASVVRAQLLTGRAERTVDLNGALAAWALCLTGPAAGELSEIDQKRVFSSSSPESFALLPRRDEGPRHQSDDRTLILLAVAKLAVAEGYGGLTTSRICAGAGIPPRIFKSHFSNAEDCFFAAADWRAEWAISKAFCLRPANLSWQSGVCRAIASLCVQVARDTLLARLCFIDIFTPGIGGVYCRERQIASIVNHVDELLGSSRGVEPVFVEASLGAVWGVIHRYVIGGRAAQLPRIAAPLSFLVLAPIVGPSMAAEVVRCEHGGIS